jgi:hypothetical protein
MPDNERIAIEWAEAALERLLGKRFDAVLRADVAKVLAILTDSVRQRTWWTS